MTVVQLPGGEGGVRGGPEGDQRLECRVQYAVMRRRRRYRSAVTAVASTHHVASRQVGRTGVDASFPTTVVHLRTLQRVTSPFFTYGSA